MKDFNEKCIEQVKQDNRDFNIKSVFLPNPAICLKPEYCLIAMEPLDNDLDLLKRKIEKGYQNFIEGYEELILHYCAYHHLGKPGFNYYITDLTKGSMPKKDADENRQMLRPRWQELLKEEMVLLGNPKRIAIGKGVNDFMNDKKKPMLRANDYILHYSRANNGSRAEEYDYINNKSHRGLLDSYCKEIDEVKFKDFVLKFIKHLDYKRVNEVKLEIQKDLTDARRKLYALYRHNFESLTNNGKVLHST